MTDKCVRKLVDSFCYWIPTEKNIYGEIRGDDWFDFSNCTKEHLNYSNSNNTVSGKSKDEMGGKPIKEFVGMRAKMCSIKAGEVTKKTAKGISTSVKKKEIRHKDYKTSLFSSEQMTHKHSRIMLREHA